MLNSEPIVTRRPITRIHLTTQGKLLSTPSLSCSRSKCYICHISDKEKDKERRDKVSYDDFYLG